MVIQRTFKYKNISFTEFNVSTLIPNYVDNSSVFFRVKFVEFDQIYHYVQCDFLPDFNSDKANLSEEQFLSKYGNIIVDGLDEFTKSALLYNVEQKIDKIYKDSIDAGIFVESLGHKFYCDTESLTLLNNALQGFHLSVTTTVNWHTMERDEFGNSISVQLSKSQLEQLYIEIGVYWQTLFQTRKLSLAQVRAMTKEQLIEFMGV